MRFLTEASVATETLNIRFVHILLVVYITVFFSYNLFVKLLIRGQLWCWYSRLEPPLVMASTSSLSAEVAASSVKGIFFLNNCYVSFYLPECRWQWFYLMIAAELYNVYSLWYFSSSCVDCIAYVTHADVSYLFIGASLNFHPLKDGQLLATALSSPASANLLRLCIKPVKFSASREAYEAWHIISKGCRRISDNDSDPSRLHALICFVGKSATGVPRWRALTLSADLTASRSTNLWISSAWLSSSRQICFILLFCDSRTRIKASIWLVLAPEISFLVRRVRRIGAAFRRQLLPS